MILWLAFALMTAAAIFAVLWPLSRQGGGGGGTEVAVYRDQLDEIGRDRAAGLIGEAEADAARIEVSRRLIAAAETPKTDAPTNAAASRWRRRATAVAGLVLLPIGATALYLALGSPQLPGEPLAARLEDAHPKGSIAAMISQVEAHLERDPNDARGYEVLAPIYLRLGRFDAAVDGAPQIAGAQGRQRRPRGRSRRGADRGGERHRHRRGQGRVRARRQARSERGQVAVLSRPCRRAGRQQGQGRDDLEIDARQCAGRRAVDRHGEGGDRARRRHAAGGRGRAGAERGAGRRRLADERAGPHRR